MRPGRGKIILVEYEGHHITLAKAAIRSKVPIETLRARHYRGLTGAELYAPAKNGRRETMFDLLEWEHDEDCQRFVREHPNGASLDEIGKFMGGYCRERVRQILEGALAKLRNHCDDMEDMPEHGEHALVASGDW